MAQFANKNEQSHHKRKWTPGGGHQAPAGAEGSGLRPKHRDHMGISRPPTHPGESGRQAGKGVARDVLHPTGCNARATFPSFLRREGADCDVTRPWSLRMSVFGDRPHFPFYFPQSRAAVPMTTQ